MSLPRAVCAASVALFLLPSLVGGTAVDQLDPALSGDSELPLADTFRLSSTPYQIVRDTPLAPVAPLLCDPVDPRPPAAVVRASSSAWTLAPVDVASNAGYENAVYAATPRTLYVASKRFLQDPVNLVDHHAAELRVARSLDGGATWTTLVVDGAAPEQGVVFDQSVAIDGQGPHHVYVAYLVAPDPDPVNNTLRLARSSDGGDTWSVTTVKAAYAGGHLALRVLDPMTLVLSHRDLSTNGFAGSSQVARSADGGLTWTFSAPDAGRHTGYYSALDARDAQDVHVAYYDSRANNRDLHLARTLDGGATWSNQTVSHIDCWSSGLAASYDRAGESGYLTFHDVYRDGTRNRVRVGVSPDDGVTWSIATLDNGTGWDTSTRAHNATTAWSAYVVNETGRLEVRLAQTRDGGATWTRHDMPEPGAVELYNDMTIAGPHRAFVSYRTAQGLRVAALNVAS